MADSNSGGLRRHNDEGDKSPDDPEVPSAEEQSSSKTSKKQGNFYFYVQSAFIYLLYHFSFSHVIYIK